MAPARCSSAFPAARRASVYLGNLGGLDAHRTLLMLENRGTGESQDAADPQTYRCDRLAEDVEALRTHLGLETVDLRIGSLFVITGGMRVAGCAIEGAAEKAFESRAGEVWYPQAKQALEEWFQIGPDVPHELKRKAAPFFYGSWTAAARAHADADPAQRRNPLAQKMFPPPPETNVREELALVTAPVLVYAGELDPSPTPAEAAALAAVFPKGRVVVQPGAGHFPWLDDPAGFVRGVLS